jgi:MYXO-CTERM domain-containing protein
VTASLPASSVASAQVAVQRTRRTLPASNGHGAVLLDLSAGSRRITHFREHLFAAEEPQLDGAGEEIWNGNGFATVHTRDLLFDAYFGLRDATGQRWMTSVPVDEDASGYLGWGPATQGGTGIATMVQQVGDLEVTQYVFAPLGVEAASFVMLIRVRNTGPAAAPAQVFSIHNFHLGFGRPATPFSLFDDIGENGETLAYDTAGGEAAFTERGFAGVVVARALGDVGHFASAPGSSPFAIVDAGGATDLPDNVPGMGAVDGAVSAWQFDLGVVPAGQDAWAGVAFAHDGDPFAGAAVRATVDTWIAGRDAQQILDDEVAQWAQFQDALLIPSGVDVYEEDLVRHSAAMLRMGQVQESSSYLREWLSQDGEPRTTRFPLDAPATLPAEVEHRGAGAILASLPPGNWTYAWIRDGAYATSAMAALGMNDAARHSLEYYLHAEGGRFADWTELSTYDMPDYLITLTRYYGFGVEETDFNEYGPNLEFDGFGLFLWALRNYEVLTGDTSLADDNWDTVATLVGDALVGLVDPATGLLRRDSSIWETHWEGRERAWTYTNITAVRGLCDAADMAERVGDATRAETYRSTALALRTSIATELTDARGALASNREELVAGEGYYDAAVLDAIAMGLFDPNGQIATATLASLDEHLLVDASEVGWARNDDRYDHAGVEDLSPWGSDYDSAEWVITDLRGAIATRAAGEASRSDAILQWVVAQSAANYLMVAETYEETTGEYKFNHPMLGFGAGAVTLALAHRDDGLLADPACGVYYEDEGATGGTTDTGDEPTAGSSADGTADGGSADASADGVSATVTADGGSAGSGTDSDDAGAADGGGDGGCGCRSSGDGHPAGGLGLLGLLGLAGLGRRRRRRAPWTAVAAAAVTLAGCGGGSDASDTDTDGSTGASTLPTFDSTRGTSQGTSSGTNGVDETGDSGDTTGGEPWGPEVDVCPTLFTLDLPAGASNPRVAGEWHDFELATATSLSEREQQWSATVDLAPGTYAYKIVYDVGGEAQWVLDPEATRRKYSDDVENSAVVVPDCNLPSLTVLDSTATTPVGGVGDYAASLEFVDGAEGSGPDAPLYSGALRHEFASRPLQAAELSVDPATGAVAVALTGLPNGKYTVEVTAATRSGKVSLPLRLVFWIEDEAFDWNDALVYMVMTDRYRNGDPSNDGGPTMGADGAGDFFGGDLEGLRQSIADGTLDDLGIRALWLSPWQTNPEGAFEAADGTHQVTGYHGYWPVAARAVDPRLGGEEALRAMVAEAHAHGIRILQDYVINHVHEDHEYVAQHPDWFRTGCVCGTPGCDWTAQALECQFQPYMPDVDHRVFEANQQWVDDAVWWLDEYDLDGLRVDAVKHVEEAATRNLAATVREQFEPGGTRYFLMGETAMGWSDCADPCNDDNYGTIAKYVGPHGLDGQFDFVLYHAASYRTFAHDQTGYLHADYWFTHGQSKWPEGAIMTPYVGSHDTPRFATMADYRGQDPAHGMGIPGNQWDDVAGPPTDGEPYWRTRLAFAWVLGLPGAPLLYYGDEYGQWGGADPNNRLMWRDEGNLSIDETQTLDFIRLVGQARRDLAPLRRGSYISLDVTDDVMVYARMIGPSDAVLVGLNRLPSQQVVSVDVVQLGLAPGTTLVDALGGPSTVVGAGVVDVTVPGRSAVILSP